eukprot:6189044-Pleurochrysis_carterae.AAC.2
MTTSSCCGTLVLRGSDDGEHCWWAPSMYQQSKACIFKQSKNVTCETCLNALKSIKLSLTKLSVGSGCTWSRAMSETVIGALPDAVIATLTIEREARDGQSRASSLGVGATHGPMYGTSDSDETRVGSIPTLARRSWSVAPPLRNVRLHSSLHNFSCIARKRVMWCCVTGHDRNFR